MKKLYGTYEIPGPIDDRWIDQFIGFLLADGSVQLSRRTVRHTLKDEAVRSYITYVPSLRIQLRDDNLPLLVDFQSKLGGALTTQRPSYSKSKPLAQWEAYGYPRVKAILELITPRIVLPAKKAEDCHLLLKACEARIAMPRNYGLEGRAVLQDFYLKIRAVKLYSSG